MININIDMCVGVHDCQLQLLDFNDSTCIYYYVSVLYIILCIIYALVGFCVFQLQTAKEEEELASAEDSLNLDPCRVMERSVLMDKANAQLKVLEESGKCSDEDRIRLKSEISPLPSCFGPGYSLPPH